MGGKKLEEILEESASSNNLSKLLSEQNGQLLPWNPDELEENEYLNHLNDWSFPIFQFYDTNNEHVLSQVSSVGSGQLLVSQWSQQESFLLPDRLQDL